MHLDADNHLVRRHFTLLTGWGQPLPTPTDDGSQSVQRVFELTPPSRPSPRPTNWIRLPRWCSTRSSVGPAAFTTCSGIRANQAGDVFTPIAPLTAAAQGHALAAVRPRHSSRRARGISPEGRLVVITGDPQNLPSSMSTPMRDRRGRHVPAGRRSDDRQPRHWPGRHRRDRGWRRAELVHGNDSIRHGTIVPVR